MICLRVSWEAEQNPRMSDADDIDFSVFLVAKEIGVSWVSGRIGNYAW